MGLLTHASDLSPQQSQAQPTYQLVASGVSTAFVLAVVSNVLGQLLPVRRRGSEPPLVFHWVPFIGSTVTYGMDPYKFFFECRKKYGDVFTFILLGKKTTVCLGTKGNDFISNGKLKDVNAEEIYSPLTTPVFGSDVVYDCPNSKLMEQKKFVKFGLTSEALRSYVELITAETRLYTSTTPLFAGSKGQVDIPRAMAELTIYTASRSLQGREVREKFDSTFADSYHYLDMGFTPINFMLPWAPSPQNRKRDFAQRKMTETYMNIIQERRAQVARMEKEGKEGGRVEGQEEDMIWNLMGCTYKDGKPISDKEIAHMMIASSMAGQHSSSATMSWISSRLASRPDITEESLEEQKRVLGAESPDLTYEDSGRSPSHAQVVKETSRSHSPIHSIMRKVKSPMAVEGTPYVIPTTHVLLAAPGVTSKSDEFFPESDLWEPHRWDADNNEKTEKKEKKEKKDGEKKDYSSSAPKIAPPTTEEEEKTDYGYGLVSKGASSPYLPFGAGRHRCIGEQFAYCQLQTILVQMVRDFKFRNLDGGNEVVGTDYSSLFSRPLPGAVVAWERRSESEKV